MANWRPLTMQSGNRTQMVTTDQVEVGSGITSSSGQNLNIGSATNSAILAAALAITCAAGAGSMDLSLWSGIFKAPTGAATFGGSANTFDNVINANGGVQRSTSGAANLVTDANTTSITIGGGAAQTTMTIGKSGQTATMLGHVVVSGNLTVSGTTTTVNSTTVDVADRVLHVNHSTGANDPVPAAICGLSVHRGAVTSVARDHAAILWDEGNSRWVFALQTAGDDSAIGADQAVKMGALTLSGAITQTGVVGLSTGTGSITINGATAFAGIAVTASGAASFDLSGGSGIFKTPAGACTIGPGAISVSGNMTMQAGTTLATTGTGNINLPQNASARFNIEGVATSANVTAANLGTLTAGGSTNADALHTHTNLVGGRLVRSGLTLWATPAAGEVGYLSGDNTAAKTDPAAIGTSRFAGVYDGVAGQLITDGVVSMLFISGLTSLAGGNAAYLSATVGKVTKTAPTTGVLARVGTVVSGAGYDNILGSVHPVEIKVETPIVL